MAYNYLFRNWMEDSLEDESAIFITRSQRSENAAVVEGNISKSSNFIASVTFKRLRKRFLCFFSFFRRAKIQKTNYIF